MSSTFSHQENTTKKTKSSTSKPKEKRTKKKVELLELMQIVCFDTKGTLYFLEKNEQKDYILVDVEGALLPWEQLSTIYRVGIRNRAYVNAQYHYYPFSLHTEAELLAVLERVTGRSHIAKQMKESYWKFINFFTFVNGTTEKAFYGAWGFFLHQTEVSYLHYDNRKKMTSRILEEEGTSWVEVRDMKANETVHKIYYQSTLNVYFDQLIAECMQGYLYYPYEEYKQVVAQIALRGLKGSDKDKPMLYEHLCPKCFNKGE